MKVKKCTLSVSTMNQLTDNYENVEFILDAVGLKITLSNGRVIFYPLTNIARISFIESA